MIEESQYIEKTQFLLLLASDHVLSFLILMLAALRGKELNIWVRYKVRLCQCDERRY